MITVDTNLLVRILTNGDPLQARRAVKILTSDDIFLPKTVLLETEWVLRQACGIGRSHIVIGFQKLLGLPNGNKHCSARRNINTPIGRSRNRPEHDEFSKKKTKVVSDSDFKHKLRDHFENHF